MEAFNRWARSASAFDSTGHVELSMKRLSSARVLWKNPKYAELDTFFCERRATPDMADEHLLRHCAFAMARPGESADAVAHADRYGGAGIGLNGGSGRAVCLPGYHVKGIGRTPLVSPKIGFAHASGGAFLEECVREAAFSIVVDETFPHKAVPTLALIETGDVQVWQTEFGPKVEHKVLLVRPQFVRPAHFQRAVAHIGADPLVGSIDQRRVALMFEAIVEHCGPSEVPELFSRFAENWARQISHGFVARLLHSSYTTSNVTMEGRLLDFGAMSAVPSWANCWTMRRPQPLASLFGKVEAALQDLNHYIGRYVTSEAATAERHRQRVASARDAWERQLDLCLLDFVGVRDANGWYESFDRPTLERYRDIRCAVFDHYQSCSIDFYDSRRESLEWDLASLWTKPLNRALQRLADFLSASETDRSQADAHLRARTCSMLGLYREVAKQDIYDTLDGSHDLDPSAVAGTISRLAQIGLEASGRDRYRSLDRE